MSKRIMVLRSIRNQQGVSTLLIVMGVGALLASFMLSLQMYIAARARTVAKIRLAYKYTFVMEDAAKAALNGRLEYLIDATCGSGARSALDVADEAGINTQACLETTGANRCFPAPTRACICHSGESDLACATNGAKLMLEHSSETMVAFRAVDEDPQLAPAFENSFLENFVENFDGKYLAFVGRIMGRDTDKNRTRLFNEAVAGTNVSFTFGGQITTAVGLVAADPSNSPADEATGRYPYPSSGANHAYTVRNCSGDQCITIRVCIIQSREPAMGSEPQVCFKQRITRSFLWDHAAAPCNGAVTCEQPNGDPTCTACPWPNRF